MDKEIYQQVQALSRMTVGELRERYIDVFGEETRSQHKDFLRKRIACVFRPWLKAASRNGQNGGPRK